jgi:hypothetical protein
MSQTEWANYTIFNDIKGFVNKEVNGIIQEITMLTKLKSGQI